VRTTAALAELLTASPEWRAVYRECGEISAGEREVLDLSNQDRWEARMYAAGVANNPAAFRQALRGSERATAEALEAGHGQEERGGVRCGGFSTKEVRAGTLERAPCEPHPKKLSREAA